MGKKIKRRDFLALMGIGGATAATVGCSQPYHEETWKPWIEPSDQTIPYVPNYYATTTREAGGCGLWIKVIGGRAVKIEGNPKHPINRGSSTACQQAIIQGLYSPERIQRPRLKNGTEITWRKARALLTEQLEKNQGKNISALTCASTGAVRELWSQFLGEMGKGSLVDFEVFSQADMVLAGEKVFGRAAYPKISLEGADMVLSLGAQYLETWGDSTQFSREHGQLVSGKHGSRAKIVQVEAKMTATGASADRVLFAKPGSETQLLLALLKEVAGHRKPVDGEVAAKVAGLTADHSLAMAAAASGLEESDLKHLAEDLAQAHSAVVLPAESYVLGEDSILHHVAVLVLNKVLGGIGKHFNYAAAKPIQHVPNHKGMFDLLGQLRSGSIDLLLIKDANPVYALSPKLKVAEAIGKAGFSIAFAENMNETVAEADLVIPVTHDLESWGEVNTYTGIDMLCQPVMKPRWDLVQAEDLLLEMLTHFGKNATATFQEYLQASWFSRFGADRLDKTGYWRECLKLGGRFEAPEQGDDLPLSGNLADDTFTTLKLNANQETPLVVVPSSRFGDGGFADRGWLHELPDPMTGVTWDSWLEISHGNAEKRGLVYGSVVRLEAGDETMELPVFLAETCSDHVVTLATGLGRKQVSDLYDRGQNAFRLLSDTLNDAGVFSAAPMTVKLTATGAQEKMATPHIPGRGDQINTPMAMLKPGNHRFDRDLYQTVVPAAAGKGHHGEGGGHHEVMDKDATFPMHMQKDFYPDRKDDPVVVGRAEKFYDHYKWELNVDLSRCNGCGSCVTACYAENNLPLVGKDQVIKGREMAWIRVNRYLSHTKKNGKHQTKVGFLPMMCQQCANAPCETVCPSLATYHTKEGLNAMVYNRCVGTRYCANNCSYKVRRFNYFTFEMPEEAKWYYNPAVTVRTKGIMEKCTFCVQRIRDAKDQAKDEGDKVRDGQVQVACQQACPSQAISFGNVMDTDSKIAKLTHEPHAYRALDSHLQTKPGVSYLKRVVLDEEHHG